MLRNKVVLALITAIVFIVARNERSLYRSLYPVIGKSESGKEGNDTKNNTGQLQMHLYGHEHGHEHEQVPVASNTNVTLLMNDNYPYMSYVLISECGLANHTKQKQPLSHSLGFIKPHKTGSSTIASIVNRIVDGRNLEKLIPTDLTYLGWPGKTFPGKVEHKDRIMNVTKYDAMSNHAILNSTSIRMYLKEPVFLFTILREPISRTISSFHFFNPSSFGVRTWRDYINYLRNINQIKFWHHGVMSNNLGFALGWYDFQNNNDRSTKFDQNRTAIQEFISYLDQEMDLVMILENTVESLILLYDGLPELDISELVWHDFKVASSSSSPLSKYTSEENAYPTETEMKEISELLLVDQMIYNHFKNKLLDRWKMRMEKKPSETMQLKEGLICLHNQIQFYWDNQTVVSNQLKDTLMRDSGPYTAYLRQKQRKKFGVA